jgi:hypothetical protein
MANQPSSPVKPAPASNQLPSPTFVKVDDAEIVPVGKVPAPHAKITPAKAKSVINGNKVEEL